MTQTETATAADESGTDAPAREEGRRNERSAISFPYSSLEDAEAVARAVFDWGGNDVAPDRIAATLQSTVKSSGFRTDVAAARIFGFVDGRGTLSLTPLGHRLVDEQTAPQARVDAFKQVPLFNALFQEHQGKVLPGPKGIEAEMLRLGVSQKQVGRARQLFQRSAQHAGFFNHSPERLVEPLTTGLGRGENTGAADKREKITHVSQSNLSPEVADLLATLLTNGADWPPEKVVEFVSTARKLNELLASD